MAEESQRIAILVRGASCTGKTSTARLLVGKEPISLDDGDYGRLRTNENVIALELGYGEPGYPIAPGSKPGATRDPENWLRVLREENRPLFAFSLTAELSAVEARASKEHGRGVTLQSVRASQELYRTCAEVLSFPTTAGIFEYPIDTTHKSEQEVAAEIRDYVIRTRPFQQWPSTES